MMATLNDFQLQTNKSGKVFISSPVGGKTTTLIESCCVSYRTLWGQKFKLKTVTMIISILKRTRVIALILLGG